MTTQVKDRSSEVMDAARRLHQHQCHQIDSKIPTPYTDPMRALRIHKDQALLAHAMIQSLIASDLLDENPPEGWIESDPEPPRFPRVPLSHLINKINATS